MNVKLELVKSYICDFINNNLEDFDFDASQIADTCAIQMLSEIQSVIKNESYSDFEAIEEIVGIFEKYNIDLSISYAYGDTNGDVTMLKRAGNRVAINPTKELLNHINNDTDLKNTTNIIVERKDIIYSLSPNVNVLDI